CFFVIFFSFFLFCFYLPFIYLSFPTRRSSDLILTDLARLGLTHFDDLSFTTDASTPSFIKKGLINICIEEAIIHGVPLEEAYRIDRKCTRLNSSHVSISYAVFCLK